MKMKSSVGRSLKRKTMLVWVMEYINKDFTNCKSLCNLQELYAVFKSVNKHSNVNIGFSKFCALRPKWCVLAGSKRIHFVCFCSSHQNVMLLSLQYLIKEIVYDPVSNKCIILWCESSPGTVTLKGVLGQELNDHEDLCGMYRQLILVGWHG